MRDNIVGDGSLFQPDTLLPSQFFAAMRKKVPQEAEYRLILAVLQDAVECFQKHLFSRDHKARQLFEDAEAWIVSDDRDWPFSFVNICEILNVQPEYLRRGLRAWQDREYRTRPRFRMLAPRSTAGTADEGGREVTARAS
jgi:hypothetical protein